MVDYFRHRVRHLFRFRHKRGYGVHSPFMFHLITKVIGDRTVYPEYREAEQEYPLRGREKKFYRLLFRLLRHSGYRKVLLIDMPEAVYPYLRLVSERLELVAKPAGVDVEYGVEPLPAEDASMELFQPEVVIIGSGSTADLQPVCREWVEKGIGKELRYLIITDIHRPGRNREYWAHFKSQCRVAVDMMWYGILLFDPKLQKGDYRL